MHALMHADIGKDWLDNPQPPGINALALLTVHFGFHRIDQVRRSAVHLNRKISAR